MEALEQLEICVNELLSRLDFFKMENIRLQTELADITKEKMLLVEEIQKLHVSLTMEKTLREAALHRIDELLRKIQEHENIG